MAPHRGRETSIQSPPCDQRTNPEMDMDTSEYTKKIANDVATTGAGFEPISTVARPRGRKCRHSSTQNDPRFHKKKVGAGWVQREENVVMRKYLALPGRWQRMRQGRARKGRREPESSPSLEIDRFILCDPTVTLWVTCRKEVTKNQINQGAPFLNNCSCCSTLISISILHVYSRSMFHIEAYPSLRPQL